MQEVLDQADAFKVEIKEEFQKVPKLCECSAYAPSRFLII